MCVTTSPALEKREGGREGRKEMKPNRVQNSQRKIERGMAEVKRERKEASWKR